MPHRSNSDPQGRGRSLLSLGDALKEEQAEVPPSRLARAIADVRAENDAATRHRLARARREGRDAAPASATRAEPVRERQTAEWPAPAIADPAPEAAAARVARAEQVRQAPQVEPAAVPPAEPARSRISPASEQPYVPPRPTRTSPVARPAELVPETPARETVESAGLWRPLIDPMVGLAGITRAKRLILLTTLIGAMLGVLVAMNTPKRYLAQAELLADPRDLNLVGDLTKNGLNNEGALAIVENQVRVLSSGTVLGKVVDKLNLADDPEFNGQGGGGFGPRAIIATVRNLISPVDGPSSPEQRAALAERNLARSLAIERSAKTFVIVVGVTTQSAQKSALIANTMTDAFLQSYGQFQSDAAARATTELSARLDELRGGVEAAERKVESFKAENDLIDAQGRLITDDEILKLNDQLATARARTIELNARVASTRGMSADAVAAGSLPEELSSPTMHELMAQYSQLKGEVDRLSARLGPRHPQLIALQSQLAGARGLINTEIRRIASATQTEQKRAVQLEQDLSSRLAQLKVRQGDLSTQMVTLRELERDANAKREVYEAYLLRARETGEQQGINAANISIISKAQPPLESLPPSRSTIVLAGLVLGLMAGVGFGALRGTIDGLGLALRGRRAAPVGRRSATPTMFAPSDEAPPADRAVVRQREEPGPPPTRPAPAYDSARLAAGLRDEPDDGYATEPPPFRATQAAARPYGAEPADWRTAGAMPPEEPPYSAPPRTRFRPIYEDEPTAPPPPAPPLRAYPEGAERADRASREPPADANAGRRAVDYPERPADDRSDPYARTYPPAPPLRQPSAERQQPAHEPPAQADEQLSMEEIQSNLRELREAIRELTESRTRRRYF